MELVKLGISPRLEIDAEAWCPGGGPAGGAFWAEGGYTG